MTHAQPARFQWRTVRNVVLLLIGAGKLSYALAIGLYALFRWLQSTFPAPADYCREDFWRRTQCGPENSFWHTTQAASLYVAATLIALILLATLLAWRFDWWTRFPRWFNRPIRHRMTAANQPKPTPAF